MRYDYDSPDGNYNDQDDTCQFCGEPIDDGQSFCDSNCKKGFDND